MTIVDRVRELVTPLVDAEQATLYDVEHNGAVVRVLVDRPDGLDLEVITRLSRRISRTLDEHDPVPGRYTLEVSSPGLERPLRTSDHFRGAVGADVKIKTRPDYDGPRRVRGTLLDCDGETVRIQVEDSDPLAVAISDISSARTVFEWGPAPKPGGRNRRAHQSDREATSS